MVFNTKVSELFAMLSQSFLLFAFLVKEPDLLRDNDHNRSRVPVTRSYLKNGIKFRDMVSERVNKALNLKGVPPISDTQLLA